MGILSEVLGENGGLAIVQRADAAKLFQMLLESAQKYASNIPPPNLIVIGIQAFANGIVAVVEASLQIVFDLQHLQIGYFGSPGYGVGLSGPDPLLNGSISVQFGYGWCLPPGCSGVADYKGWFFSGGFGGGIPGTPISFGGEYDTSATGSFESGGAANNYTQIILGSVGIGSALINGYVAETYSIPIGVPVQYPNTASFNMAMYLTVSQYDRSLGLLASAYSSIGYPYLCSVASNTATCPAR